MPDPIELGDVQSAAVKDQFWAARGHAIQAYANLEQSLCSLFAYFTGIERSVAGIIFFKITAARSRDSILEKLLKEKHGTKYTVFWNSITKLLGQLADERNHIVHWNAIPVFSDSGFTSMELMPPNALSSVDSNTPRIDTAGLAEFIRKCDFVCRLCNIFGMHIAPQLAASIDAINPDEVQTWRDIFQQPAA